ncbi:MAG: riboflavin synthase [Lachnospiraceae bacterium]|nr:riboflavin synthase [Lachnospiraceae bacterium]
MFTGIIEEMGTIREMSPGGQSYRVTIGADKVLEGTQIGDSIAVNGICLTVTEMTSDSFSCDVMAETVRRTSFRTLRNGSRVNLERALTLSARLGGHIVSGHIDGTGTISGFMREDNAVWITINAGPELLHYMIEKGSVALDGVSLTIAYVDDKCLKVSIIPHTGAETILLSKDPGDPVNIECDLIGKYVEKLLGGGPVGTESPSTAEKGGISAAFLMENGFM